MDTPQITVVETYDYKEGPIYFVNGVLNTMDEAVRSAQALSVHLEARVHVIHNPTGGMPGKSGSPGGTGSEAVLLLPGMANASKLSPDGAEYMLDRLWFNVFIATKKLPPQHNPTTRQLTHLLYHADGPIKLVSHSQGSAIVRNAVATVAAMGKTAWIEQNLTWVACAPPMNDWEIWPPANTWQCKQLTHRGDPIVEVVGGRGGEGITDADFGKHPYEHNYLFQIQREMLKLRHYQNMKTLTLKNATTEPVKVWIQYETQEADRQWRWVPADLPSYQAITCTVAAGQNTLAVNNGQPIKARRTRIWAESESGTRWSEFRDQDLWLLGSQESGPENRQLKTLFDMLDSERDGDLYVDANDADSDGVIEILRKDAQGGIQALVHANPAFLKQSGISPSPRGPIDLRQRTVQQLADRIGLVANFGVAPRRYASPIVETFTYCLQANSGQQTFNERLLELRNQSSELLSVDLQYFSQENGQSSWKTLPKISLAPGQALQPTSLDGFRIRARRIHLKALSANSLYNVGPDAQLGKEHHHKALYRAEKIGKLVHTFQPVQDH
jgi:hypothetical protein